MRFADKVQQAFQATAERADAAGHEEWSDRIRVAAELWDEHRDRARTDLDAGLLALDATIIAQAAGPHSGLVDQWLNVVRQLGARPNSAIPTAVDAAGARRYLDSISPLMLARALALLMLGAANEDREDPVNTMILDSASAALMVSPEAASTQIPADSARLVLVAEIAEELLDAHAPLTRTRVDSVRKKLVAIQAKAPNTTHSTPSFRLPSPEEAVSALDRALGLMQDMETIFSKRA